LRSIVANPTIIASAVGLLLVLAGVRIPPVVLEPVRSLADMAIPAMLLAYGLSLYGSRPLAKDDGYRGLIAVASTSKLLLMPVIALGVGLLLGLRGTSLYEGVVMAALPTAQNVYVAAARYRASENRARDTVLITTIGTVLVLLLISAVLGVCAPCRRASAPLRSVLRASVRAREDERVTRRLLLMQRRRTRPAPTPRS